MGALAGTSVAILGPDTVHRRSLQTQLLGAVREIRTLPESYSVVRPRATSRAARLRRRRDELTHTRDGAYLDQVLETIDEARTDVVVAFWGTLVVPDLIALRRRRPGLRLVLMVLTHPLGTTRLAVTRQRWRMTQAAAVVDGFVVPTQAMSTWFRTQRPARRQRPVVVVPPCWPSAIQPVERAPALGPDPNVIFMGRPDPSGATAIPIDDVGPHLRDLLDAGIHVHHGRSADWTDGHPLRHEFPPMRTPELLAMATRHDASVVTYALAPGTAPLRFELSVPDRLISSCAAGVPVALPSHGYGALAEYLRSYGAVVRYENARHLATELHKRDEMAELRERAWQARTAYTAEAHGPALRAFLSSLG